MRLYCDMDGVLVDFNLAAMKLMNEAMQLEGRDTIAAFAKFRECIDAAMSSTQSSLNQNPAVGVAMESVYGALAAYAQQVLMELRAEDPGSPLAFFWIFLWPGEEYPRHQRFR